MFTKYYVVQTVESGFKENNKNPDGKSKNETVVVFNRGLKYFILK
jgi:hypothetical protein